MEYEDRLENVQNRLGNTHYLNLCKFYNFSVHTSDDRKKIKEIREEKARLMKLIKKSSNKICAFKVKDDKKEEVIQKEIDQFINCIEELNKQEKELVLELNERLEELQKEQAYLLPLSENGEKVLDIKYKIDYMNYIYGRTKFYYDKDHDTFVLKMHALREDLIIQVEKFVKEQEQKVSKK